MSTPKFVLAVAAELRSDKSLAACNAVSALSPCAAVAKTEASCKELSANKPCAAVAKAEASCKELSAKAP